MEIILRLLPIPERGQKNANPCVFACKVSDDEDTKMRFLSIDGRGAKWSSALRTMSSIQTLVVQRVARVNDSLLEEKDFPRWEMEAAGDAAGWSPDRSHVGDPPAGD
jgi:hypothetical protein